MILRWLVICAASVVSASLGAALTLYLTGRPSWLAALIIGVGWGCLATIWTAPRKGRP